jgi:hypothetical protein
MKIDPTDMARQCRDWDRIVSTINKIREHEYACSIVEDSRVVIGMRCSGEFGDVHLCKVDNDVAREVVDGIRQRMEAQIDEIRDAVREGRVLDKYKTKESKK